MTRTEHPGGGHDHHGEDAAHRIVGAPAAYASGYAEYRKLAGTLKGLYHRLNG